MNRRRRVLGVDFSGARDAGNRIWIASGCVAQNGLQIEDCIRARDLPGGAAAREIALPALVEHLGASHDAVAGLDFPFSLPQNMIDTPTWRQFVVGFASRFGSAERFRADCMRAGDGRELKRRTDREARVPFGVYNLRLYRQTWSGIAEILAPLVRADAARIVPMQAPAEDKLVIAEICPASILKAAKLYPSYKGRSPAQRNARGAIIRGLQAAGELSPLPARLRRKLVDDQGGDALDAVIAAIGAARTLVAGAPFMPIDRLDEIEGRIYF